MSSNIQAVIFDLDGTLLDTLTDLANSGNAVLEKREAPTHPTERYKTFIGEGMENLVRAIFPESMRPAEGEETEAVLADYKSEYESRWNDTAVAYAGISELLDECVVRGLKIGVLSNKAHAFCVKCVDGFLPQWKWDVIFGQRDGIPRKPDPAGAVEAAQVVGVAPENCLFIGDSGVDMKTAKSAGMIAVGVKWGFREVSELQKNGADHLVGSPAEILDLITARSGI